MALKFTDYNGAYRLYDLPFIVAQLLTTHGATHGLRIPNEGTNQSNLEKFGPMEMWQTKYASADLKIWEWELIFRRVVKVISLQGVRSPWCYPEISIKKSLCYLTPSNKTPV